MSTQLIVAVGLVCAAVVLVVVARVVRHRAGGGVADAPRPLLAAGVHDDAVVERAADWVHTRLSVCALGRAEVLTCVGAVHAFIRANAAPMNGGGTKTGYLVPPNMFDVVQALHRDASAAGIDVGDECAWELVRLHDDFLRTRR